MIEKFATRKEIGLIELARYVLKKWEKGNNKMADNDKCNPKMQRKNDSTSLISESLKEKLGKYTGEKAFFTYIVSFMLLIPGAELITELIGQPYVSQPLIHSLFGYVGLVLVILWFIVNWGVRKIKPSDIFFWTLVIFALVALICSNDITESTDGYYYEEWISNFFAYFSLMFAATHIESYERRKKILYVFIGLALAESVICLFQSLGIRITDSFYDPKVHAEENLSFGLAQHQNFYGGLSVLFFGACSGLFVLSTKKKLIIPAGMLVGLVLYGSLSTSARLTWIGNTAVVMFLFISLLIMKKKKNINAEYLIKCFRHFGILILIVSATVAVVMLSSDKIQSEIAQSAEEFAYDDTGFTGNLGNSRVMFWKVGFESVPDNWLTGVGLDNFIWCFHNSKTWQEGQGSNHKAHNEYFHILFTEGVPALLNYLVLLIYAVATAIKNIIAVKDKKQDIITWIFLAMFAGYAAQALVNSSVINIAMYFWVTIGMVMPVWSQKEIFRKGSAGKDAEKSAENA